MKCRYAFPLLVGLLLSSCNQKDEYNPPLSRCYVITFKDEDGKVVCYDFTLEGKLPSFNAIIPNNFNGFDKELTPAYENKTYVISYSDIIQPVYNGEEARISSDGKSLTYGLYPQHNVRDSNLLEELNKLTESSINGWYLYNDEYYCKEVAKPYFDYYMFDDLSPIIPGAAYWFKCEPIKWSVLPSYDDNYYLLADKCLDAHIYDETSNVYETSSIRSWLNNEFYNTAFSLNKNGIKEVYVDNSGPTTNLDTNPYATDYTKEKVFLLSYKDYRNTEYGFVDHNSYSEERYSKTTEYARVRGARYSTTKIQYFFNAYYWSRSPSYSYYKSVCHPNADGKMMVAECSITCGSVRPSIILDI